MRAVATSISIRAVTLVAISAAYGAGGSQVAPAVAERLGVPFVDRAIPMAVAEELDISYDDAATLDEQLGRSWLERVLSGFIGGDTGVPSPTPAGTVTSDDFRRATEDALMRQASSGSGVILGRGAVVVLREDPRALRVRLDGPPERRLEQAMRLGNLDRETAERAMKRVDRVHFDYAKHFYGVELRDLSLYHLVLDSTSLALEACVDLIAEAVSARH
jgi:cytidylate kinase